MTGFRQASPLVVLLLPFLVLLFILAVNVRAAELQGHVLHVFDGDTLLVEGIGKVRLVGIDAPETEASVRDDFYWRWQISPAKLRKVARRAKDFCQRQTRSGPVTIIPAQDPRDRHGRLLAYVRLADGQLLNRLLLERGLAAVYRRFDFQMKEDFLLAEKAARRQGCGLWRQP